MSRLIGSICLSDIPRSEMKKVVCRDGVERVYLNIAVVERKEKGERGDTHFITCEPKRELRKEGVKYIIGNLKPYVPKSDGPTEDDIANAPSVDSKDAPF